MEGGRWEKLKARHQKRKGKCLGSGVYQRVLFLFSEFCAAVLVPRWEWEQCLSEIKTTQREQEEERREGRGTEMINTKAFYKRGKKEKWKKSKCGRESVKSGNGSNLSWEMRRKSNSPITGHHINYACLHREKLKPSITWWNHLDHRLSCPRFKLKLIYSGKGQSYGVLVKPWKLHNS